MSDWVQKYHDEKRARRDEKGGPGSGHHGHAGRPGQRGGSAPGKGGGGSYGQGRAPTEEHEDMMVAVQKLNHLKNGLDMGTTPIMYADKYTRVTAKMQIAADLAKRTGLPPWQIDGTIEKWSNSSSDTNLAALQMQKAVAEEFGLEFARVEDNYQTAIREREQFKHPFETVDSFDAGRLKPSPFSDQELRKLARAMYESTQESLAAAGFGPNDVIRLQRGTLKPVNLTRHWERGSVVRVGTNPLSSWTGDTSTEISQRFARPGLGYKKKSGFILEMEIPVSSIFSTARTGFGCLTEAEFVILAGEHEAKVVRVYGKW